MLYLGPNCLTKKVENLESSVKDIQKGKEGKSAVWTALKDFDARLQAVETSNKCVLESTGATGAMVNPEIKDGLKKLEDAQKKVDLQLHQLISVNEEGMVSIKHEDFLDVQDDVFGNHQNMETMSRLIHLMGKWITSLDHRATMNTAKLMRNTLIFKGVRCYNREPPTGICQIFY